LLIGVPKEIKDHEYRVATHADLTQDLSADVAEWRALSL